MVDSKIVCLGGGIGSVNLINGLKNYTWNISVVISMADEGGSGGRLRRLYTIAPPGDFVSCMAALTKKNNKAVSDLLRYRFPGNRYGKDNALEGQKMGNLLLVALRDITGSFDKALLLFQEIFQIEGEFLPVTEIPLSISAQTIEGKIIDGEEKIDLGKYNGKRVLEKVFLRPANTPATPKVIAAITNADVIIAGPGDLYTTILPVLIVPGVAEALLHSPAKKLFVINVTNKPFETKGYSVFDYVNAIKNHLGVFPFDIVITNNNFSVKIPKEYRYSYVHEGKGAEDSFKIVSGDLVDSDFPLYHSCEKLASVIKQHI